MLYQERETIAPLPRVVEEPESRTLRALTHVASRAIDYFLDKGVGANQDPSSLALESEAALAASQPISEQRVSKRTDNFRHRVGAITSSNNGD